MLLSRRNLCFLSTAAVFLSGIPLLGQNTSPEQVLNAYRPRHRGVEIDTPPPAEVAQCRVETEYTDGNAAYVLYSPAGQLLRKFVDTNGDRNPDELRFYRMGLEVYRDIDSDFDNKPDQSRWMNWAGTRWGIDRNEDGRIDEWKMISAPEAAQVAVEALIAGDAQMLSTVLINAADVRTLQVDKSMADEMLKSVSNAPAKLRELKSKSRVLTRNTKWMRFDPPVPGLIPADGKRFKTDMTVYENAMGIVQNGKSHELVSIGEMVRVGDTWKLTQLPRPLDSENTQIQMGGVLMQPTTANSLVQNAESVSQEMQTLLKQLEQIDRKIPDPGSTAEDLVAYNRRRADVIERIIPLVKEEKTRDEWIRQYADGLAAAVQTGKYPDGLQRLVKLQEQLKQNKAMLGHIWYRRLLAEYAVRLQKNTAEEEREATQDWWLGQLEQFASRWPKSDDAADAIIQLAISLEIMGRLEDAQNWYRRLATEHPRTNGGIRARGALRRLDLTGKRLELAGKSLNDQNISAAQYQGKVLLVTFWATWATPYAKDLPVIEAVHNKYRRSGFEVLGVNLDADAASVAPFIQKYGGRWNHIRDAGGTDGKLAKDFGIVSVPTMFLVDKRGIVAGGITAENLDQAVESLLKGQPLGGPSRPQGSAQTSRTRN